MKKKLLCCLASLMMLVANASAQQKISILGDSYSTYGGYVTPSTNWCWYNGNDGGDEKQNDVSKVEQTWWHLLAAQHGMVIDHNNSFSGSTICHTGYDKKDYSDRAFITRIHNLGNPDILLIFGGTNDSWAKSPIGYYQYGNWSKTSLYSFRPAFAYLLEQLKELYPETRIINITNSELSYDVTTSMDVICKHYGITNIQLKDIDKQWGHPSIKGMKSICEQVWNVIK